MQDFSFKRDFKFIQWPQTFWVNFLRSFFAGIIFAILASDPKLLFTPVVYFIFFLPVGIILGKLAAFGVPVVGLLAMIFSLMVIIGDPLVFVLHKINKKIVPVEKYNIFNFRMIIFVIDEGKRALTY